MKKRNIILGILAVLIVIVLSFGVTKAFMKPIEQGGNLTEIALSSCAKIKLTGESSIDLSNTYPMSRNRGLQTTPYTFTVTSYCDTYVGFNLYLATLSSNTLPISSIHYVLTDLDSKEAIVEGVFDGTADVTHQFSDREINELSAGLKEKPGKVYQIHSSNIPYKGTKKYNLYLFLDESVTNETMGQTFKAGVAVKAYDRSSDNFLSTYILGQYKNNQNYANIYYHGSSFNYGAKDNSYRYAGANPNNYICFGSAEETCSMDNLYRIVGVFGKETHGGDANLVKIIKYDTANSSLLGTDGNFVEDISHFIYQLGTKTLSNYRWSSDDTNSYTSSGLIKTNLNVNFKNNIGYSWTSTMPYINWNIGAISTIDIGDISSVSLIDLENTTKSTSNQVGLLNLSDYKYSGGDGYFTNENFWIKDNWLMLDKIQDATFTLINDNKGIMYYNNGPLANVASDVTPVRPSFYLDKDTMYASGDGSIENPIRIIIPHNMRLIPREILEDEKYIIDLLGLNEDFNSCITQDNQKVETSLDLAKLKQKTIDITCSNSEGKKINEYIMIDDFDAINNEFQNVKNKYGDNTMLYVSPEGETKNIDTFSYMVNDVIIIRDNINLDGIAEAALQEDVVFVYVPYLSETNRLTLIEKLKAKGMNEACVITNNYLLINDMTLSEFLKEYSESL